MEHTITIKEIQNKISQGVGSFMKKDDSPRGCSCTPANEIKVGDEIIINNYFTTVTNNPDSMT